MTTGRRGATPGRRDGSGAGDADGDGTADDTAGPDDGSGDSGCTDEPEICNGLDDDCDGDVDEGLEDLQCDVGICEAITPACADGEPIECIPDDPNLDGETCDGTDDDCDGEIDEGCDCVDGDTQACYSSNPERVDVGLCQEGTQTCADGQWGDCVDEVTPVAELCDGQDNNCDGVGDEGDPGGGAPCDTGLFGECANGFEFCVGGAIVCTQTTSPAPEICGNGIDEDCDGVADDNEDLDGDGWGICDNDCCDAAGPACATPGAVNPGAFEEPGNGVDDDDCDGMIDNPVTLCGLALASNSNDPLDYARAIDLCQFTTEPPPLDQQIWGVIDAELFLADESGAPNANARSIRPDFGVNNTPQQGQNFSVLSTGFAAAPGQVNPAHAGWEAGNDMGTDVPVPAAWLAANGGAFPNAPGCSISANTDAHDSVTLRARIRVPTNANSFSVAHPSATEHGIDVIVAERVARPSWAPALGSARMPASSVSSSPGYARAPPGRAVGQSRRLISWLSIHR